jgi:hypothetical protein
VELEELIARIRDVYVNSFAEAVRQQRQRGGSLLVEACFNDEATSTPTADPFHVPMRQDLVPVKNGNAEAIMVVRGPVPRFEQVALEYTDGFQVGVGPFTWDECRIVAVGIGAAADLTPVIEWFADWADLGGEREPDAKTGLTFVAHHVDVSTADEELTAFDVDLGTAPAEALEDLIGTLKEMGATHVIIGAFDTGDDEG